MYKSTFHNPILTWPWERNGLIDTWGHIEQHHTNFYQREKWIRWSHEGVLIPSLLTSSTLSVIVALLLICKSTIQAPPYSTISNNNSLCWHNINLCATGKLLSHSLAGTFGQRGHLLHPSLFWGSLMQTFLRDKQAEVFLGMFTHLFQVRVPFFSGVLGAFLGFYLLLVLGNLALQLGLCRYILLFHFFLGLHLQVAPSLIFYFLTSASLSCPLFPYDPW